MFISLSVLAAMALAAPTEPVLNARANPQQICDNSPGRIVSIAIDKSFSSFDSNAKGARTNSSLALVDFLTSQSEATATNKADTVSIIAWDSDAKVLYPQGDPNDQARGVLNAENLKTWGMGNLKPPIEAALNQLSGAGDRGSLIMLTDHTTDWPNEALVGLLTRAKEANIRVHWALTQSSYEWWDDPVTGLSKAVQDWSKSTTKTMNDMWGAVDYTENLVEEIAAAVLATGGTYSKISRYNSQLLFPAQIIAHGVTNVDGQCTGIDRAHQGGLLANLVTTGGDCSQNGEAVYTYSPKSQHEKLFFSATLVSDQSPVNLEFTYTNKATGETKTVLVNKQIPRPKILNKLSQTIEGAASPGQQVEVRVKTTGADNNMCIYGLTLVTSPGGPVIPVPSSQAPSPSPSPSATSSVVPPPASSSPAPPPSSSAPPPPASSSAPPPPPSSSAPPAPSSATVCPPAPSAATVTNTVTQTQTVTGPVPSSTVCICKCDAPGAKPMPKFEL